MKMLTLRLVAFGPFRDEQTIDFTAFDDERLFLIAGRTGAGKSSILDAIVFALFNRVPRSANATDWKGVRSHYADVSVRTRVELEFAHDGERYRVTREPEHERPKSRGTGTTTDKATASLERWEQGAWIGRAHGPRDVAKVLDDLLPLSADEFLQVALLAQNQFQAFLQTNSATRQTLLARLFDTREYRNIGERIDAWRRAAHEEHAQARMTFVNEVHQLEAFLTELAELGGETEAVLARHETPEAEATGAQAVEETTPPTAIAEGTASSDASDSDQAAAEEAALALGFSAWELRGESARIAAVERERLHGWRSVHEQFERAIADVESRLEKARADERDAERAFAARASIAAAEQTRRELESERDAHEQRVAQLEHARAAREVLPFRNAVERAERGHDEAIRARARREQRLVATIDAVAELGPHSTPLNALAREAMAKRDGTLTDQLAEALEQLRDEFRGRLELITRCQELERERGELEARVAVLAEQAETRAVERASLPGTVTRLTAERDEAVTLAARSETLTGQLAAARERHDLVLSLPQAEARRQEHGESYAAATRRLAEAEAAHARALEDYLAGTALRLADELRDGEPCPVCGAKGHPSPAQGDADERAVTADDVDVAAACVAEARTDADAHRDAFSSAEHALTTLLAQLDGLDEHASSTAITALEEDLARASEAHDRVEVLRAEIDRATVRLQELHEAEARGDAERTAREQAFQATTDQLEQLVPQLPAEGDTRPDAALAELGTFQTVVREFDRACLAERQTQQRHVDDRRAFTDALEESPFADADALAQAVISREELSELDAQVTRFLEAQARVAAVIDDEQLRAQAASSTLAPDDARARREALGQELQAQQRLFTRFTDRLEQSEQLGERLDAHIRSCAAQAARAEELTRLAQDIRGTSVSDRTMGLESYVLAAELSDIIEAANVRLHEMSSGRYELQHDGEQHGAARFGLGIQVLDAHTGRARSAASLSGGETFLASLALALGLADVVSSRAGGVSLDTLFIDEGFGSLDQETLATAMNVLDELRRGGRTVGVISHVTTMHEAIPAQLEVVATPSGGSIIRPPRFGTELLRPAAGGDSESGS